MAKPFVLDAQLKLSEQVLGLEGVKKTISGATGAAAKAGQKSGAAAGAAAANTQKLNQEMGKASKTAKLLGSTTVQAGKNLEFMANKGKAASTAVTNVGNNMAKGGKRAQDFGDSIFVAGRRYAAFIAATTGAFVIVNQFKEATAAEILDAGSARVAQLKQNMLDLGIATGTNATEITQFTTILAQAGFRGEELNDIMEVLAKIPLLPAFESTEKAADGLIATIKQFKLEGSDASEIIEKLNNVANTFAITSQDIFEGFKRSGAVWAELGGNMNDYIALLTTIRERTRLNIATIGTALRTMTARVGRVNILRRLRTEFGVREAGPESTLIEIYEALAKRYDKMNIAQRRSLGEMLGGFRQVDKVLAGLGNWDTYNKVIKTVHESGGTMTEDIAKGMEKLETKIGILGARWNKFVQNIAPDVFIPFIEMLTRAGDVAIDFANAIKPILPLLTKLGALWAGGKLLAVSAGLIQRIGGLGAAAATAGAVSGAGATAAAAGFWTRQRDPIGAAPGLARGGIGRAGQIGIAGAAAGIGRGTLAGAQAFGKSPLAVLAALSVVAISMDKWADNVDKANEQTGELTDNWQRIIADMAKFSAGMAGLILLFPGLRTVLGSMSGLGKGLGLGVATAAAAAFALNLSNERFSEALNNKISEAVDNIKFVPGDATSISRSITTLFGNALNAIDEEIARTDIAQSTGFVDTLKRIAFNIGDDISDALSFDPGFFKDQVTEKERGEKFRKALSGRMDIVQQLFDDAFETGEQWAASLKETLSSRVGQESTQQVFDIMVELAGGMNKLNKEFENFQKKVAETAAKVAVRAFVLPKGLTTELITFEKAIKNANLAVSANTKSLSNMIDIISGREIGLPEFSAEAIKKLFTEGRVEEALPGFEEQFPDITTYITNLDRLTKATEQWIQLVGKGDFEPESIKEQVEFFAEQFEIPDVIGEKMERMFVEINSQAITAIETGGEILVGTDAGRFIKEFYGDLAKGSEEAIGNLQQALQEQNRQLQVQSAIFKQMGALELATAIRGTEQVSFFVRKMNELGASLGTLPQFARFELPEAARIRARRERRAPLPLERREVDVAGRQAITALERGGLDKLIKSRDENSIALSEATRELNILTQTGQQTSTEYFKLQSRIQSLQKTSQKLTIAEQQMANVLRLAETAELAKAQAKTVDELAAFDEVTRRMVESGATFNREARRRARQEIEVEGEEEAFEIKEQARKREEQLAKARLETFKSMVSAADQQKNAADIQIEAARTQKENTTNFSAALEVLTKTGIKIPIGPGTQEVATGILSRVSPVLPQVSADAMINLSDSQNALRQENELLREEISSLSSTFMEATRSLSEAAAEARAEGVTIGDRAAGTITSTQNQQLSVDLTTSQIELKESQDRLNETIKEGGNLKLDAAMDINTSVEGLGAEIADEVKPQLEAAGIEAAKIVVKRVLADLARFSDTENAIVYEQASRNLP
jgi:TP901 family phage tail tape measure protein